MTFLNLTLTFCSKDKLKQHISAIEKKGKRQVAMLQSKNLKEPKDVRSAHIEEINNKDKKISVMFVSLTSFVFATVIIKDQITHIRYICQSIMSAAQHNRSLVEELLTKKRDLMREKQGEMDRLVIRHRDAIVDLCQRHSEHMPKKDTLLKKSEELVQGFQATLEGLLIEMRQTKVTRRKADELSKRAAHVHSRCLEQEILNGSLTDEICDARATSIELKTKIEDYEVLVDYIYDKLDS